MSKNDPVLHHNEDLTNEGEQAYYFSVWFGAVITYLCNFGAAPFDTYYSERYRRRNMWIGYFTQLIIVALAAYLFFIW